MTSFTHSVLLLSILLFSFNVKKRQKFIFTEAGCGVICNTPDGQGKNNVITTVSEKERISNSHYRLDYLSPVLDSSNSFTEISTFGLNELIITGSNFGFNATVKLGNVIPYFDQSQCLCTGGLICGHDTTAAAASSSAGGRGCFLPTISSTHTTIVVYLPQGIGTNIELTVISVNQIGTAKLSFASPVISRNNFGLQSTQGTGTIVLHGINFGLHPSIADTYNIGTVSHLVVDSPLGLKRSNIEPNGLNILSWNHTTIKFQTPEGDGINW